MPRYLRIINIPLEKGKLPVAVIPYLRDYSYKHKKDEKILSSMEHCKYLIDYERVSNDNDEYFDELDKSILDALRRHFPLAYENVFPANVEADILNHTKKYELWFSFPIGVAFYEDQTQNPSSSEVVTLNFNLITLEDISVFTKEPLRKSPLFNQNEPMRAKYEERFIRNATLLKYSYPLKLSSLTNISTLLALSPLTPIDPPPPHTT